MDLILLCLFIYRAPGLNELSAQNAHLTPSAKKDLGSTKRKGNTVTYGIQGLKKILFRRENILILCFINRNF